MVTEGKPIMTGPHQTQNRDERREERASSLLAKILEQADTFEERAQAFRMADAYRQSQAIREMAAVIGKQAWGSVDALGAVAQAAIARWCLEVGIDPARHIYVLGGRIYDNAELYYDKLAADPNFSHDDVIHLAPLAQTTRLEAAAKAKLIDAGRLKALQADQRKLNAERLRLQDQHNVPVEINDYPETAAAVLVRLHFKDGVIVEGVNWAGSMGRTYRGKEGRPGRPRDPVGDESPVKTATARALRKAAKKKEPLWFKRLGLSEDRNDANGLAAVEEVVTKAKAEEQEPSRIVDVGGLPMRLTRADATTHPLKQVPDGGYGFEHRRSVASTADVETNPPGTPPSRDETA